MSTDERDLVAYMLVELRQPRQELTKWELGFLSDVSDRFEREGSLAPGTVSKLKQIYEEKSA